MGLIPGRCAEGFELPELDTRKNQKVPPIAVSGGEEVLLDVEG
jgi:hypothetical protein